MPISDDNNPISTLYGVNELNGITEASGGVSPPGDQFLLIDNGFNLLIDGGYRIKLS